MAWITGRRIHPELMDDPDADRVELDRALGYLRAVNRRLGGASLALRQFKQWARRWPADRTIRVLDVGTGSADIPLAIAEWARGAGHRVHVTGIDLHQTTVDLARRCIGDREDIEIIQADALTLTDRFEANAFDYAHAGLFLHHLNDVQVMTVLRMMDRLASRGVIWNDLIRGVPGKLGVRVLMAWPGVPKMVRHDAVVSVAAGFTRREALDLARRAGLANIRMHSRLFYRFALVSEKG